MYHKHRNRNIIHPRLRLKRHLWPCRTWSTWNYHLDWYNFHILAFNIRTLQSQGEHPPGRVRVKGWCYRAGSTTPCPSPPSAPPPSPSCWCSWHRTGVCYHFLSAPDAAQSSALRSSSNTRWRYTSKGSVLQSLHENMYAGNTDKIVRARRRGKALSWEAVLGHERVFIWRDKTVWDENAFGTPASLSASPFLAMWNLYSHRSRFQVDRIFWQESIFHP